MKTIIKIIVLSLCTGCTVIKSPTWSYTSFGFQKEIGRLTVQTNGTINVEGYTSKDSQIAEGIARGVATGLNPVKK